MKRLQTLLSRGAIALILLVCTSTTIRAQTVFAGWNTSTLTGYGPSPFSPTTTSNNITVVGFTRGSGVTTINTAAARAWGGNGWDLITANQANAISNNNFVTISIQHTGYIISLTSIDTFDYRRSNRGPTNGVLQYSINAGAYTDIMQLNYTDSTTTGVSLGPIDLSGIAALQNIPSTDIVNFRIANWGAIDNSGNPNPGGTWYIFDKGNSTASDFKISGTVISESPTNWYRSISSGNWNTVSIWQSSALSTGPWAAALNVPTSAASGVEIQGGFGVTMDGSQTINGKLTLTSGTLNINGNTLTLNGTTSGTGATITGLSTSNLVVGGTATLPFTTGGTNNYLKDVTINGTGTLGLSNALNITAGSSFGTVTVNGTGKIFANGFLTLKSDANGTARCASSLGTILGNVTIERYIPARRAWRLLSFPTVSSQTIKDALQEGATNPDYYTYADPKPGYGTQVTLGLDSLKGYDPNGTLNTSMKRFSGNNWISLPAASGTYTQLNSEPGYFVFVRGNRSNNLSLNTSAPTSTTILESKGSVNNGNIIKSYTSTVAGGYILVGNIYPSSIMLDTLFKYVALLGNVDTSTFKIWDPSLAGAYGVGGYIDYGAGTLSVFSTNYNTVAKARIVQSGGAVLLKLKAGKTSSGNITFTQSAKTATEFPAFARPSPPSVHIQLRDTANGILDGVAVVFTTDSVLIPKSGGNIMLSHLGALISTQAQPLNSVNIFPLEFAKLTQQTYHLRITQDMQDLGADFELVDSFLQKHMDLKGHTDGYAFTVTADTASYKHRFMLIAKAKHIHVPPPHHHHDKDVHVYPNPTAGKLYISVADKPHNGWVSMTDVYGRTVIKETWITNGVLNCSSIVAGLYFIQAGDSTISVIKQ